MIWFGREDLSRFRIDAPDSARGIGPIPGPVSLYIHVIPGFPTFHPIVWCDKPTVMSACINAVTQVGFSAFILELTFLRNIGNVQIIVIRVPGEFEKLSAKVQLHFLTASWVDVAKVSNAGLPEIALDNVISRVFRESLYYRFTRDGVPRVEVGATGNAYRCVIVSSPDNLSARFR